MKFSFQEFLSYESDVKDVKLLLENWIDIG